MLTVLELNLHEWCVDSDMGAIRGRNIHYDKLPSIQMVLGYEVVAVGSQDSGWHE